MLLHFSLEANSRYFYMDWSNNLSHSHEQSYFKNVSINSNLHMLLCFSLEANSKYSIWLWTELIILLTQPLVNIIFWYLQHLPIVKCKAEASYVIVSPYFLSRDGGFVVLKCIQLKMSPLALFYSNAYIA